MKKHPHIALVVALFAAGTLALGIPSLLAGDNPPAAEVTSTFKVEGMTCGGCEVGVRMNVKKLDGVADVEASYEEGQAEVTYDPDKVTPEEIVEAIEKLGYTAKLEESEETAATQPSASGPGSCC